MEPRHKKHIRILALAGAVILVLLYLSTLILALIDSELAFKLLKGAVAATILIPVVLYGCIIFYRLNHPEDK